MQPDLIENVNHYAKFLNVPLCSVNRIMLDPIISVPTTLMPPW